MKQQYIYPCDPGYPATHATQWKMGFPNGLDEWLASTMGVVSTKLTPEN